MDSPLRIALLSVLAPTLAWAEGLVWAQKQVEVAALADVPAVEARFAFRNEGTKPVRLVGLAVSCRCTTASFSTSAVAPGEQGEVVATVRLEQMTGAFTRTVFVTTDEGPEPTALDVKLQVTPLVAFTPRLLWWRDKDRSERKEVRVALGVPGAMRVVGVRAEKEGFRAEWVPEGAGGVVRVTVEPAVRDTQSLIYLDYERAGVAGVATFFATVP